MKLVKHIADQMTPNERFTAIKSGRNYDRIPCVPFIGNMRLLFLGVNGEEYWQSAEHMVNGEILAYNRFGFDRLFIGPNTRGISDALSLQFSSVGNGKPVMDDYGKLDGMDPVNASSNPEISRFLQAAETVYPEEAIPLLEICFRELGDYQKAYQYACKQRR